MKSYISRSLTNILKNLKKNRLSILIFAVIVRMMYFVSTDSFETMQNSNKNEKPTCADLKAKYSLTMNISDNQEEAVTIEGISFYNKDKKDMTVPMRINKTVQSGEDIKISDVMLKFLNDCPSGDIAGCKIKLSGNLALTKYSIMIETGENATKYESFTEETLEDGSEIVIRPNDKPTTKIMTYIK